MAAATTDVREWLRSEGHDVPVRGAIRQELRDLYDDAHPAGVITGEVLPPGAPMPSDDDFPEPHEPMPAEPPAEQRPRPVRPSRRPKMPRLFGRRKRRRRRGAKFDRMPLGDFLEETWMDLAWLARPVPPLAMILQMQAPYAGAVADEHIRGTVVDAVIQPVARYSGLCRALNGLVGPPLVVLLITLEGRVDPETGKPDMRTQMLLGMLEYSLLQMTRVSEISADEIQERTLAQSERQRVVEAMIRRLFRFGPGDDVADSPDSYTSRSYESPSYMGGPVVGDPGFRYPQPPRMDDTGSDPGRSPVGSEGSSPEF